MTKAEGRGNVAALCRCGGQSLSWVDWTSIFLDLLTLLFIARATREIKASLRDARAERLDINRRLEVLSRRIDKREAQQGESPPQELIP